MAKRSATPVSGTVLPLPVAGASPCTPVPPDKIQATLISLSVGEVLHRVHQNKYLAAEYNPGTHGNARFSPIQDEDGKPIPTLYGGTTMVCALMETVFHDVPYTTGFKSVDKAKLDGQVHSTVEVLQALQLVDLASVPLRNMGVTRNQLIDTEKDQYPATRMWAEAIHRQCPQAQGLSWISRQDDSARAVVLFGDRVPAEALKQKGVSWSLLEDDTYNNVLDLAARIGVCIVPGNLSRDQGMPA